MSLLRFLVVAGMSTLAIFPAAAESVPATSCSPSAWYGDVIVTQPETALEFAARDAMNQLCATERNHDQMSNPLAAQLWADQGLSDLTASPGSLQDHSTRPRLNVTSVPGGRSADPFRAPERWQSSGRGSVVPVSFIATDSGARLKGEIWLPPNQASSLPGVIIATGGTQQWRGLYNWLAQGLAEAGYQVMTFDFQGQGDSESLSHGPDGRPCPGASCATQVIPPEQYWDYSRYYSQLGDAIRFFFSSPTLPFGLTTGNYLGSSPHNPAWQRLDRASVGVVGHSLGGIPATDLGQDDQRIKAIVRMGFTGKVSDQYLSKVHAPQLTLSSDYGSKPGPFPLQPLPGTVEEGYRQMVALPQGVDTMLVSLRASTSYEWAYQPGKPASRLGERVSFYYVLAWMDAYLKGQSDPVIRSSAISRLTANIFDSSADDSSIGTGRFEIDPTNGQGRNVPYRIDGMSALSRLSYQFRSAWRLSGGALECSDVRLGC